MFMQVAFMSLSLLLTLLFFLVPCKSHCGSNPDDGQPRLPAPRRILGLSLPGVGVPSDRDLLPRAGWPRSLFAEPGDQGHELVQSGLASQAILHHREVDRVRQTFIARSARSREQCSQRTCTPTW